VFDESGNVAMIVEHIRDITEVKRAEDERKKLESQLLQAQKMEAIGQLAGGIAHDFNNLLTAIIGCSQIILGKIPADSPLCQYAQMVVESGEKAAGLTQSLLAFSRKQVLNPKPADLREIVQGVKKILGRVIREDIDFTTSACDTELVVMADKGQIEQVLMNFVTNANDAMPRGGTLSVDVAPFVMTPEFIQAHGFGTAGHYACVSIADTGCGMNEEIQRKIFDPFFTTKEPGKGTGLGMSIVYGIIKQHNGFISLCSEPGSGTTFRVYLPLLAGEKTVERGAVKKKPPRGGTETILLAEDDENVRKMHRIILEDRGYTVITAVDGEDALARYRENRGSIAMLATDVVMPKLDGNSLLKEIRKLQPDMKVLFMSGYPRDIVIEKGVLDEGSNYMSKPVKPYELLERVRSILDR
jgi:signal transduction histidine kinase